MEENTTHDKVGIARIVLGLRLATQVHHGSLDGARAWIIIGVNGWNRRGEAHCRAKVKSLPCDEPSKHWVVGKRCAAEDKVVSTQGIANWTVKGFAPRRPVWFRCVRESCALLCCGKRSGPWPTYISRCSTQSGFGALFRPSVGTRLMG